MDTLPKIIAFSPDEKAIIFDLVRKHKTVIENKKTDAVSNREKKNVWAKITSEFNACNISCKRNEVQLKRCWEKAKTVARKVKQQERQHAMATGGGTAFVSTPEVQELVTVVSSIQPYIDLEVSAPWDSNQIHLREAQCLERSSEIDDSELTPSNSLVMQDGPTYCLDANTIPSPSGETAPETPPVLPKNSYRLKSTHMVQAEVDLRMKKLKQEMECQREAHEARMKQDQELHVLRVARERKMLHLTELEIELKKRQLKAYSESD